MKPNQSGMSLQMLVLMLFSRPLPILAGISKHERTQAHKHTQTSAGRRKHTTDRGSHSHRYSPRKLRVVIRVYCCRPAIRQYKLRAAVKAARIKCLQHWDYPSTLACIQKPHLTTTIAFIHRTTVILSRRQLAPAKCSGGYIRRRLSFRKGDIEDDPLQHRRRARQCTGCLVFQSCL